MQKAPRHFLTPPIRGHQRSFFINGTDCRHPDAVEVRRAIDDELVAWLCPDCDAQLEADWPGPHAHAMGMLIAAGLSPRDAQELAQPDSNQAIRNGHAAEKCPARIEVTRMRDRVPRYVHGACPVLLPELPPFVPNPRLTHRISE